MLSLCVLDHVATLLLDSVPLADLLASSLLDPVTLGDLVALSLLELLHLAGAACQASIPVLSRL